MTTTTPLDTAAATLRDGIARAATALPDPGQDSHPDLAALGADLRTLAAADHTAADLLDAYDSLQQRLERFRESARAAAVAHDQWSARGCEGPDPADSYARGDLLASDTALRALYTARTTATGIPADTSYFMVTAEGNAAVHAQVLTLAELIRSETLNPRQMTAAIRTHIAAVAEHHGEIHDTEPEWAIVDALNPLLRRAGYAPIDRDDL